MNKKLFRVYTFLSFFDLSYAVVKFKAFLKANINKYFSNDVLKHSIFLNFITFLGYDKKL